MLLGLYTLGQEDHSLLTKISPLDTLSVFLNTRYVSGLAVIHNTLRWETTRGKHICGILVISALTEMNELL